MSSDCDDVICIHKNNALLGQLAHSFFASDSGTDEFFNDFFSVVFRRSLFYYDYLEFSFFINATMHRSWPRKHDFFYVHSSVHGNFDRAFKIKASFI